MILTPGASKSELASTLSCVERCNKLVNEYWSQTIGKVDAILTLQDALSHSPSGRKHCQVDALEIYVTMLNEIDGT